LDENENCALRLRERRRLRPKIREEEEKEKAVREKGLEGMKCGVDVEKFEFED